MLEIVKFITAKFAEYPEKIEYLVNESEEAVEITVVLEESDMGKVIGRQGKIAKALRTIIKAASAKESKKYNIEIKQRGEVI